MILAALSPLLLAVLVHAGPIVARDEAEGSGGEYPSFNLCLEGRCRAYTQDQWATIPVTRLHWSGDYTKCLGVESAEEATKAV